MTTRLLDKHLQALTALASVVLATGPACIDSRSASNGDDGPGDAGRGHAADTPNDADGGHVCRGEPGAFDGCNGVDDDCDGDTDEDELRLGPCRFGEGACAHEGESVCVDGRVECRSASLNPPQPQPERCNGVDDDCDGETDEGYRLGAPCTVGKGMCQAEGVVECGGPNVSVCGATPGLPSPELCDRMDTDCDGQVDETAHGGDVCAAEEGLLEQSCEGQFTCHLDCPWDEECSQTCLGPGDCVATCVDGGCRVDCGPGEECHVRCPHGCMMDCSARERCDVYCSDGGCGIVCSPEGRCVTVCYDGHCNVSCPTAGFCNVDCRGGFCNVDCRDSVYCAVNCQPMQGGTGGGCNVDCRGATDCRVGCQGASDPCNVRWWGDAQEAWP